MAQSMDLFQDHNQNYQHGEFIDGSVVKTFFQSQDSFYKVLLVKIKKDNIHWNEDKIVITGDFGQMESGKDYRFLGHLVHHPKYGDQFKAINYENNTPTSRTGLIKYLSGDDFPGVGKQTAKRVVDALGLNLIEVVLSNSKALDSIHLSAKQRHSIIRGINANNGMEQVIIGLNSYGFGSHLASAIFKKYRGDALRIIHSDPYRLVADISGISFRKADLIAKKIGIPFNSEPRLRAGLITALRQLSEQNGDTYTKAGPLIARTMKMLNNGAGEIDQDQLARQLLELARQGLVVGDGHRIYLTRLYQAEIEIAKNLRRIQRGDGRDHQRFSARTLRQNIEKIEQKLKINYDASQVRALMAAMKKPLFLLTGGPGTGKTTIIKGLISLFADLNNFSLDLKRYKDQPYPVLLAAPTGRAANQMNEVTGVPASTIHRLLGLTSYSDLGASDPVTQELQGKILIIDEMSMVDTYLFRDLVKSIPTGMRVILVGDKDQLPSVGPGQVFHDLLQSHQIPQLELTTIHRQDRTSTIIPLAHDIKNGQLPKDFTAHKADRSFIACNTQQIGSVIRQIVQFAKMKGFSASDMQVLAPMYRGEAGINHLNEIIQQIMNPRTSDNQKEIVYHGITYRIGDKVLQLVNSPENDIFNGDIGKVVGINLQSDSNGNSSDELIIAFAASEVTYKRNQWDQITLAYCTSIHKAQGSEFKMVILPMVPQYMLMLQRNLLYTAVTRASKLLVLIGDYNSFRRCVKNGAIQRNTSLALRLKEIMVPRTRSKVAPRKLNPATDSAYPVLTNALIRARSINPMIGMHGLSPYHFLNNKNSL